FTNNTSKNIARRQGVIDLHFAWSQVKDIDQNDLIGPDVLKSLNALGLAATLWNNDAMDKNILHQSYWNVFREHFDKLNSIDELIPGKKVTCKGAITKELRRAYKEMEELETRGIKQTKL